MNKRRQLSGAHGGLPSIARERACVGAEESQLAHANSGACSQVGGAGSPAVVQRMIAKMGAAVNAEHGIDLRCAAALVLALALARPPALPPHSPSPGVPRAWAKPCGGSAPTRLASCRPPTPPRLPVPTP